MSSLKQTPISCAGHTRPVVDLNFSDSTPYGYFLISACKGEQLLAAQDLKKKTDIAVVVVVDDDDELMMMIN